MTKKTDNTLYNVNVRKNMKSTFLNLNGGGDRGIYEINIDNLFLINFVMNLYFYSLAAKALRRTATRIKVTGVSFAGALLFCILLFIPGIPVFIKRFIGPLIISMSMTAIIFRIRQINEILQYTGYMFVSAFLLGGIMKFLFTSVPLLYGKQESIWYILGIGMISYQIISWWITQMKKRKGTFIYNVKLFGYGNDITIKALVDSGNSLREPVSGKPVSVIESEVLDRLKGVQAPEKFKIIPYRSIGKDNGIMEGYEIPEMMIEDNRGKIRWQKVIVGISRNKVSANGKYQMILHPDLYNEATR